MGDEVVKLNWGLEGDSEGGSLDRGGSADQMRGGGRKAALPAVVTVAMRWLYPAVGLTRPRHSWPGPASARGCDV